MVSQLPLVALRHDWSAAIARRGNVVRLQAMQSPFEMLAGAALGVVAALCLVADWSLLWDLRGILYRNLQGVVPDEKWGHLVATSLQGVGAVVAYHFAMRALGEAGPRVLALVAGLLAFLFTIGLSQVAGCAEVPELLRQSMPAVAVLIGSPPDAGVEACGSVQKIAAWLICAPYVGLPIVAVMALDGAWRKFRKAGWSVVACHEWLRTEKEARKAEQRLGKIAIEHRDLVGQAADEALMAEVRAYLDRTIGEQFRGWRAMLDDGRLAVLPKERERIERLLAEKAFYLTEEYAAQVFAAWKISKTQGARP